MPSHENIANAMQAIVGDANCIRDEADQAGYVTDYRKIHRGRAAVVVRPGTTAQVGAIMRWCFENGVPVVPQGGNTSLMGGAVPAAEGAAVVLSLARMNKVLEVDPVNDTITVEAGVTLHAARTAAEASDRLFPLRIGSEGSCQIGGNLSTNAGGTAVLRYGTMRDLVLGIEAVTADGRIYSGLRGLRKDNTGYDLKQLFVGSEGTLGIITAAVLKLFPKPTSSAVAMVAVQDPAAAVQLLGLAKRCCGQFLSAFELISGPALELVLHYLREVRSPFAERHDWMVLIELTSTTSEDALAACLMEVLEAGVELGFAVDATVASSLSQAETLWRIREDISDAQTVERGSVRCDVSVPISEIARFIDDATRAVLAIAPRARMVIYGHMGDGNVHFNPLRPEDVAAQDFLERHAATISRAVDDIAHAARGSISAEHGIGVAKRDELLHYKSRVELEIMWSVKRALDPNGILNPGKVLPALEEERDSPFSPVRSDARASARSSP
jgi:FAD/FMN-containing dehydrogenase